MATERRLEDNFINQLKNLNYIYRPDIIDRDSLERNFREKFNALNKVNLTDQEFPRLLEEIITPDIYAAANILRQTNTFERDDGTPLHYTLVNIKDWCKNTFEVIHQLRVNTDNSYHRYDVILLLNGLPLVQIELKNHTITPRRAMQQIVEYKNTPGNGYTRTLLCFMQIFIVSNGNDTWYFANNNPKHFAFEADERFLPLYQFADKNNKKITSLGGFTNEFLAKCTLAETISRYMVLVDSEQKLLMMRPYQVYAVKALVDCIEQNCGNGYIWHTTGSGKTLTSFKASTLLKENPHIEKCLFVVDRKDLDRQTRDEFNKFQEGCVEENTNTGALVERLLSPDYADKVIVTTIQKLALALDPKGGHRKKLARLSNQRVVFIFDECHRSQFGENHQAIKEFFPKAQLFGFTGTPIFDQNASYRKREGEEKFFVKTKDVFQNNLHTYTITNAIEDHNVLRFHIDYYQPESPLIEPSLPSVIAKRAVVETILTKHPVATANGKFNALLATASINDAIEYYQTFKDIQMQMSQATPDYTPLKVACVFSPPAGNNSDLKQMQEDLPQEQEDNKQDPNQKQTALTAIIADYNSAYGTNHRLSEFDAYYKDVQLRIKNQQYHADIPHNERIDITIVVDMLLTGFDSKYLNTLYVDKNLKYHGLIQAFSRTNRVLNETKPYGQVIDFRKQEGAVDEAICLFSGENSERARRIWVVEPAPELIEKYHDRIQKLEEFMAAQGLEVAPSEVANLKGDMARNQFVTLFKEVQRLKNQLDQYTDLDETDKAHIEEAMSKENLQGFRGYYLEVAKRLRDEQLKSAGKEPVANEELQQQDFELVLFNSVIIDYDYIMNLIAKLTGRPPEEQEMSRRELFSLIAAEAKFINEQAEIKEYINTLKLGVPLSEEEIRVGYESFKVGKSNQAIKNIAEKHGLDLVALAAFKKVVLQRLIFDEDQLRQLMEPLALGWKARNEKELALMADLAPLLRQEAHGQNISGLDYYD